MNKNFKENLKYLRTINNYTQQALALLLLTNNKKISFLETGRIEPNLNDLTKLSKIFNVSSDYLLGIEDESGVKLYNESLPERNIELTQVQKDTIGAMQKLSTANQYQVLGFAQALEKK